VNVVSTGWTAFEAEVVAACDLMNGEIKEAMATLDPQKGPPKPAPGALVEREAMPERRDWWGEECPDRRGE